MSPICCPPHPEPLRLLSDGHQFWVFQLLEIRMAGEQWEHLGSFKPTLLLDLRCAEVQWGDSPCVLVSN